MTTEAQIQANQINSLQSTGPKDTSKSCFNALKHGLLSKELCVKRDWISENPREYKQILQFLLDDLKPTSVIESIFVERITQAYWRLRRVQRAEHGLMLADLVKIKQKIGWSSPDVSRTTFELNKEEKEKEANKLVNLPPIESIDVLNRYETMLERQIYRALNQLEKMRQQSVKVGAIVIESN